MILYFTGTGNSRYVAEKIAEYTNDQTISINKRLMKDSTDMIDCHGHLVIVVPTYAYRIPKVVYEWLQKTPLTHVSGAWFVMTCGANAGNEEQDLRDLCKGKGIPFKGKMQLVMPDNYIPMYNPSSPSEAAKILDNVDPKIKKIAGMIIRDESFPDHKNEKLGALIGRTGNPLFYRFYVKTKNFKATDKCISCGLCAHNCPLNNIRLVDGKPVWGNSCTHCVACISLCPKEAIEYGFMTKKRNRYHLPGYRGEAE